MSGVKRSSGRRSNIYSESKYTNWSEYDPFDLEISTLPDRLKSELKIEIGSVLIPIYVRNLHSEFIHPVSAEDVKKILSKVPSKLLNSLEGIYLLGGTSKQLKASKKHFQYGCYQSRRIYLYAFPRWMLVEYWGTLPKPTTVKEYESMGAKWKQDESGGWWLEFDRLSLRRFYLFDVLLHELGHHTDKRVWSRDNKSAEGYAEWFARDCTRLIRIDSNEKIF